MATPDPVTTKAALAGAKIAKAAWPAGLRAKDAVQAHKELGEILPEAIALALCPTAPTDPTVTLASEAVWERLRSVDMPLPDRTPPGRLARILKRFRRVPKVSAYGSDDFFDLLRRWMTAALNDPGARQNVRHINCHDVPGGEHEVAARFPAAFFKILSNRRESRWRTALLDSLKAADEKRSWYISRTAWAESALYGSVVGGSTALAAGLAGAQTDETLAAGLTATGLVATARVAEEYLAARRAETIPDSLRKVVRQWLKDFAGAADADDDEHTVRRDRDWAARFSSATHPLCLPTAMLDHLAFLRSTAAGAGGADLVAALFDLENSLRRAAHVPSARADVVSALTAVADVVGHGPSESVSNHQDATENGGPG